MQTFVNDYGSLLLSRKKADVEIKQLKKCEQSVLSPVAIATTGSVAIFSYCCALPPLQECHMFVLWSCLAPQ